MVKRIALLGLIALSLQLNAQNNLPASEALYIYNFLRYIKWPDNGSQDKMLICVFGENPVYTELIKLTKDRKVGNQSIVVLKTTNPRDLSNCHLVFIPAENSNQIKIIKQALGNRPALIVSEKEGTNAQGSNIELFVDQNKLMFRIDKEATNNQHFTISHELINMSKL